VHGTSLQLRLGRVPTRDAAGVAAWCTRAVAAAAHLQHAVDLGSSEEPATHWLVVDRTENRAYVAPVAIARAIVRAQELEARP